MDITEQPSPEIKLEDELHAKLMAKAMSYGIEGLTLKIESGFSCVVIASLYDPEYTIGCGSTFDRAVDDLKTKIITPAQQIANLRDQIAELEKKATALETAA